MSEYVRAFDEKTIRLLSKKDMNVVDNRDYFNDIRAISSENINNNEPKLKFLTNIFANIRTYGKKTPGLGVVYDQFKTDKDKTLGHGFLRSNEQNPRKYISEYLLSPTQADRRAFISELYNFAIQYFEPHFYNILFLYGLPSIPLVKFLSIFGEDMTVYEELFTVVDKKTNSHKIAPGPLGCAMIDDTIYMGINKNPIDPKNDDYHVIKDKILRRLDAIRHLHHHQVIFVDNVKYWSGNRHVAFKRANKSKMACNNGSTCIEPVLFNYLVDNGILNSEHFRTKTGYSYTCLWVGNPGPKNESEYIIGTKNNGFHERMYERLFTEYYLRLFPDKAHRDILIDAYHIVFNLMLACPGCQMNYNEIITTDVSIPWNREGCEKDISADIKIDDPKIIVKEPYDFASDSEDDEKPSHKFRSKKNSGKMSKSKKSAPKRKSPKKSSKRKSPKKSPKRKSPKKSKKSVRKSKKSVRKSKTSRK